MPNNKYSITKYLHLGIFHWSDWVGSTILINDQYKFTTVYNFSVDKIRGNIFKGFFGDT